MRRFSSLALVVLALACGKPGASATTDAPATADAAPPEPQDPVEPLCAALLPTLGKWDSREKRRREIAALIDQEHVGGCDERGPKDAQPAPGSDEASYCRAAIGHEICGRAVQSRRSIELRTRAFPESADAWLSLASLQIAPLQPESAGLPYNEMISPHERLRIAGEVLTSLAEAQRLRPDDPRVYDLIAVANEQRMFARGVVERPTTPEEKLDVERARVDAQQMTAAREKLCKLQRLPSCRPNAPARELLVSDGGEVEEEVPLEEVPLAEER